MMGDAEDAEYICCTERTSPPHVISREVVCAECGKGLWLSQRMWEIKSDLVPICHACARQQLACGAVLAIHPAAMNEALEAIAQSRKRWN